MIGTAPKPLEDILGTLEKHVKIAVTGCNGCSKVAKTGGEPEVNAMAEKLREFGKEVPVALTPERGCYIHFVREKHENSKDALSSCDAVLVLGCGGATHVMRQYTEELGLKIAVKTGLDTVGHVDIVVPGSLAIEQCGECGECILNETGAICPVTKCAKSLLNGPCGGSENGKCEVDTDRDCAWVLIYNRLQTLGELNSLKAYRAPRDHRKMNRPRRLVLR
ncbi:MAG: methylenetetrahydrofolate reductase C-terminal domain-containing protein [Desulfomonile tiedjei]|uniref:Methylenetetrahydrofolate reductase C-terminal domain-containing protein n=1 Tax=Desulfomonile tiedjei TaxID=2358 RepID=A0A9D6V2G7_9BACT|nr:methylenetetrahydrofolate reductase C-terminal domain-containing protein [Desulfomonile tiedjei]